MVPVVSVFAFQQCHSDDDDDEDEDMTEFVYHIRAKTNDGKDVSVISLG